MKHRIFTMNEKAFNKAMSWDEAIERGEVVTVKEFDRLEDAIRYYIDVLNENYEKYGVE